MTGPTGASEPWFETAFGPFYLELYGHRDEEEAREAVGTILARLRPAASGPAGSGRPLRVLDIACGAGRHLQALAGHDCLAIGLDLSAHLLGRARCLAGGRLVRADMRRLPFRDGAFDTALSMFTSLGYFHDPGENRAVLLEARRILACGGGMAIDYFNAEPTLAGLVAENDRVAGRYRVIERRRIVAGPGSTRRIVKSMEILEEGRVVETLHEEVMILSPEQIEQLLIEAGFEIVGRLGDYCGAPFDRRRSPRCLLLARRGA